MTPLAFFDLFLIPTLAQPLPSFLRPTSLPPPHHSPHSPLSVTTAKTQSAITALVEFQFFAHQIEPVSDGVAIWDDALGLYQRSMLILRWTNDRF
ncbi:hypothetical protein BgiMline_021770 [Biomphalaria glabrata]|nr:hypothetical protein BgiMline_028350 [Biomphalaria glabrata]KAI8761724.1 hypothetical protein BgiBS90_030756 [Biomphalaria glabrata]